MPNPLENFLIQQIKMSGPVDVGSFMAIALGHPEHGYYMNRDPFGRKGDFITSPEVSQMFGEMVGAWAADIWMKMGSPKAFVLLECGPGRGTLMADIMRAGKAADGFTEGAQVHLLEMSPVLMARQRQVLAAHDVQWHESLESVPSDMPIIVVANEFLDALPFRQLVRVADGWAERVVDYHGGAFCFGLRDAGILAGHVPKSVTAKQGEVFEIAPAREAFVQNIAARLKAQSGAALFFDYGHVKSAVGDTFQAIKGHEYADVLKAVGRSDLTSHVDFEALSRAVDVFTHGPIEQGAFLKAIGIEVRADILKQKASSVEKDLHRLTHADEMGALFKVLGMSFKDGQPVEPAGF